MGVASAIGLSVVLTVGVLYVRSFGDAPQTPSHDSWVDQAHTALDASSSDVATDQLLLRLLRADRVLGNYQQVVALDSESAAGKVSDHLAGEQPSPVDQATYTRITQVLSDAGDLLATVRMAVVRSRTSQYPALQLALSKMQQRIANAQKRVPS
jgi:hypothetical protein